MTMARVLKEGSGWAVLVGDTVVESGLTNQAAWRMADKLNLEPLSRQENVSDWVAKLLADKH